MGENNLGLGFGMWLWEREALRVLAAAYRKA
jgi:hypothetical protein